MKFLDRLKAFVGAAIAAGAFGIAAAGDDVFSFDEISGFAGLAGAALVAFWAIFKAPNKPAV